MSLVVDTHAHIQLGSSWSMRPLAPQAVVDHYAGLGVDRVWYSSVDALLENQSEAHRRYNDQMAELQRTFGDRFVGMATVNPREGAPAARELERAITQLHLGGLKLHGWLQPVSCTDACLEPIFEVANGLRLVVVFHDGTPPYTGSLQIAWLAERYPDCTMILGHGGLKDLAENALQAIRRHPNVYMQTDGPTLLELRRAVTAVGPERMLFGSDGGFGDLTYIDYQLLKFRRLKLPPAAEAMILGDNAQRLLPITGADRGKA